MTFDSELDFLCSLGEELAGLFRRCYVVQCDLEN